ncbi:ABC transporter permease [Tessaracoccus oleiagri]|uniref:ABC-type nitrate/sulfonate/bicarbonate transport system, permease component n=1 Tax=Tessaracoccus oleiagri TaxID=686624 RepID=A0A1G9LQ33_9ACTN|nr:ABC transporter permease [Tessaracoccus oleiagri]SDL63917.1 ABC-type nitrate/sulfonate/bicarbonate transport system, permease component [Tessaracoccus oleiagri]
MNRWKPWVLSALGAVLALVAWWIASDQAGSIYFPPLQDVLEGVWTYWVVGDGGRHLASSMVNLFAGLAIGVVGGFVLGLLIGQSRLVRTALTPSLEFVRAIPATALIPFAMVVFGLGSEMKIFIIALGTLFPILLNVIDGARELSQEARDTASSFGIRGWQKQWRVVIPSVLPRAAAGIRIALPLSLVLVVTSEMTGSNTGIGYVLITAQNSFNQTSVWGAIVLLGVLGVILNSLFGLVEHRLLAWDKGLHRQGDH